MNKKILWILGGIIVILSLLAASLFLLDSSKGTVEPTKTYTTANGGTISAVDKASEKVALNEDGTSVSDALYEYKSTLGYSVQYNNKYIVDFGKTSYDLSVKNSTNTVNVIITKLDKSEDISAIQTKEEWDAMMGVFGESNQFTRTTINNMEALVADYIINGENGAQGELFIAMLLGDEYIYNYMYTAAASAPEAEKTQIGAMLYTMRKI